MNEVFSSDSLASLVKGRGAAERRWRDKTKKSPFSALPTPPFSKVDKKSGKNIKFP